VKQQRLLITTAHDLTSPSNEKVLFLGEWCIPFSRNEAYRNLDHVIASYHWDDRQKLLDDFQYLDVTYEKLLSYCAKQLNEIHKINYSIKQWRIILGPWLGQFSQTIFDRWSCIKASEQSYQISETVIIEFPEHLFIPNNQEHFGLMSWTSEWNHYLMADIIQNHTTIACRTIKPDNLIHKNFFHKNFTIQKPSLLRRLFSVITKASNFFSSNRYAFFLNTYLPTWKEIFLQIRMWQLPRLFTTLNSQPSQCNPLLRVWDLDISILDEFETVLYPMIMQNIPLSYLEDFDTLSRESAKQGWPENPSMIWTSNSYSSDDCFKIWAARNQGEGVPIVIGQHGGGIGTHLFAFYEQHQISISDLYFSWGWDEQELPHVHPLGLLKSKKKVRSHRPKAKNILMVTVALQQQSYHLYSSFISSQYLSYLDDQFEFTKHLSESLQEILVVRANERVLKGGWETNLRWAQQFPNVTVNYGEKHIDQVLPEAKICVGTYNATFFLEALHMNIPTIVFWNPDHWELRDQAKPYFQHLLDAKILFYQPREAALHLNKIANNIDEWWDSPEVIKARKMFTDHFCRHNPSLLRDIHRSFIELKD
jgi:putative transferase (TIGR04331 family)